MGGNYDFNPQSFFYWIQPTATLSTSPSLSTCVGCADSLRVLPSISSIIQYKYTWRWDDGLSWLFHVAKGHVQASFTSLRIRYAINNIMVQSICHCWCLYNVWYQLTCRDRSNTSVLIVITKPTTAAHTRKSPALLLTILFNCFYLHKCTIVVQRGWMRGSISRKPLSKLLSRAQVMTFLGKSRKF